MLFNSLHFAFFLPLVFALYWFINKRYSSLIFQNVLLLAASYFFYACWDWRFLFLLIFSTALDYYTGIKIEQASTVKGRKIWFWISVGVNLGFLAFFKYYNFFAQSFADTASFLGIKISPYTLQLILPVGVSFYTFHGLSYVIDIYKNRIKAERNFINYSLFVSFFPLLVAGPIERATHLLPQLIKPRSFEYARSVDGIRQILWGLFKKIVIADQCSEYVNIIFSGSEHYNGSTLFIGAVFFAFQIYGDFSGYSDIALGTARLFGIELLRNFAFPYFSRDIAEFWRRWHISLSSWFRDYVYIPLGGSKVSVGTKVRNTFIIFIISGFWHGANWTFIVWGLLNAIYFLPLLLMDTNRNNLEIVAAGSLFPGFKELLKIIFTFSLTVIAWVFFRSDSVSDAVKYLNGIFSVTFFYKPEILPLKMLVLIAVFLFTEWIGRENKYAIEKVYILNYKPFRWGIYLTLSMLIFLSHSKQETFIYFQF